MQLALDKQALANMAKAARDRAAESIEAMFRHPDARKGLWTDEMRSRAEVCLTLLGAAFGIKGEVMRGENGGDGFDVPRAYVVAAAGDKHRSAELSPSQFAEGMRAAMRECRKFPSYGLLRDLARGKDVTGYAGGMLRGQDDPPSPVIHARWEALAREWDGENRLADRSNRGVTTREVGRQRVRQFLELMGETFTVGDWPAEERT